METLRNKLEDLRNFLKISEKKEEIKTLEAEMREPAFWLEDASANDKSRKLKNLKDEISGFDELYQMSEIADDAELETLRPEIERFEKLTIFSGKYDQYDAILNFYAGAGGDDAQDWTEMLLRMYLRWAENMGMKTEMIYESRGGEAGIKSATISIDGAFAYGNLRLESGVHRLVRQSPFNAKALRQTSFALVQVLPKIESDSDVEIDAKDLKIDVFRAGGHGGQSVNTTDSAVRITHLPTNIVVSCQNERSQLQNKESAMKVLRSRLAQLLIDQHKERIEDLKGDFSSPEWGNQIRSYVLHPYKMVKDHRTNVETSDPDKVLSGGLAEFIEAELKSSIN
ncbi:MAG: peptide chain release factor 2 [Patescibacteria group bacterium]|jgi:peptide chain release factor 2